MSAACGTYLSEEMSPGAVWTGKAPGQGQGRELWLSRGSTEDTDRPRLSEVPLPSPHLECRLQGPTPASPLQPHTPQCHLGAAGLVQGLWDTLGSEKARGTLLPGSHTTGGEPALPLPCSSRRHRCHRRDPRIPPTPSAMGAGLTQTDSLHRQSSRLPPRSLPDQPIKVLLSSARLLAACPIERCRSRLCRPPSPGMRAAG